MINALAWKEERDLAIQLAWYAEMMKWTDGAFLVKKQETY